jgi:hypothetical protein
LKANVDLDENNTLITRTAFAMAKDENDKPIFNLFDCIIFSVLFTDRDGFNDLETDAEFSTRIFEYHMLPKEY